jgi:hypothetical protein
LWVGLGWLLAATPASLGAGPARLALLPFENRSGITQAGGLVTGLLGAGLEARGFEVVQGEPVEEVLEAERVRYLDSLPPTAREHLLSEVRAQGIVSGAVETFLEGANPIVGLSVRLSGPQGEEIWSRVVGLSGSDTEGWFGRGRKKSLDELAREAVRRLLVGVPGPGEPIPNAARRGRPFRLAPPRTFRAAALENGVKHRVCILPLENLTSARQAGRTLGPLLARRLGQAKDFEVVEPVALRAAMVKQGVRSFRDMDPEQLRRLGRDFGTSLFVQGTVYTFLEASPRGSVGPPQVSLDLALVDVTSERVLWTSDHSRRGDEYEFLLGRGGISNIVSLADQVFSEMVVALEEASPTMRTPTSPTHGREPKP